MTTYTEKKKETSLTVTWNYLFLMTDDNSSVLWKKVVTKYNESCDPIKWEMIDFFFVMTVIQT